MNTENPAPPRWTVRIEPAGYAFEAMPGQTLLRAAQQAGVELPSSCRNGTCRTCLCRMVEGTIRYQIDWPGVSVDERDEGLILPCVAEPTSNVTLDVPLAYQFL
ncbi:2Fe-2S iron-sulfur cluster-binding protein [Variovorax rhizosphaerae]|uniref:2Fe-2S iron-sulfur cluster-binding protein n=1 Tax=Variovorax rhizosphaerae TaxID=1836200 RepID=A0ABU8WH68_9BURK